jgi:hypothetical protein
MHKSPIIRPTIWPWVTVKVPFCGRRGNGGYSGLIKSGGVKEGRTLLIDTADQIITLNPYSVELTPATATKLTVGSRLWVPAYFACTDV